MATPKAAQVRYLLELGDDLLVLGHRLSEWCGHGPSLEEDIALANIALDCLGQAQLLLEEAGRLESAGRDADALAFFRDTTEFRNCLLVEQPNGDFAQTMLRQFYFDAFHYVLLSKLCSSSAEFLAAFAAKAKKETTYHLRHSSQWVIRLGAGTAESHARMTGALSKLSRFTAELFIPSTACTELVNAGISVDPAGLKHAWNATVTSVFAEAGLLFPDIPGPRALDGRDGVHTEHLGHLLAQMQSTARAHPQASW